MIHLHGGGWAADESAWTGRFVAEAAARAAGPPLIAVVLWSATRAEGEAWHDDYRDDLRRLGAGEARIVQLCGEETLDAAALRGVHGIFVGGGLTPAYHRALIGAASALRALTAQGVPYLGYSAGAMIAGDAALLGGWRAGGVQVVGQEHGEGLDELTLAPGLGLVRPVVDAHAGRGTLARAVALVASGRAAEALAVDEDTCAIVEPGGSVRAAGLGAVWRLSADAPGGVRVRRLAAS